MPCCGQKRAALRTRRAPAPGPVVAQPPPSPPAQARPSPSAVAPPQGEARIEYLDQPRIQVRGAATGRDAESLLRTSFFRRA